MYLKFSTFPKIGKYCGTICWFNVKVSNSVSSKSFWEYIYQLNNDTLGCTLSYTKLTIFHIFFVKYICSYVNQQSFLSSASCTFNHCLVNSKIIWGWNRSKLLWSFIIYQSEVILDTRRPKICCIYFEYSNFIKCYTGFGYTLVMQRNIGHKSNQVRFFTVIIS